MFYKGQIADGDNIRADDYSWIATLHYRNELNVGCYGSVINVRYVLTSSNCVCRWEEL